MTIEDRVRFLPAAIEDLRALARKDPHIVRLVMKKVLLVDRDPYAGEPLGRQLSGFRKLVIGDRHWRLVWRIALDGTVEIAEIWGVGARADSEIYAEVTARLELIDDDTLRLSLRGVLDAIDAARSVVSLTAPPEPLPGWLREALLSQVGLPADEVDRLSPAEGNDRLAAWYSRLREDR